MKIKQLIVLFVLLPLIGFGQMGTKQKSAGLDDHVKYVNETIHGILIVQRLMQSFNQEINKYVDLEGYPLQNFGNEYLI